MKKDKDFVFNKIATKASLLFEEYRFLGLKKDSFNVLVYDIIDKYFSSFKDEPHFYDTILKKVKESLDNVVKIKAAKDLNVLCDAFVSNYFIPASSYINAMKNFNKFEDMFFSDNFEFDPSAFSHFLLNNKTFDYNLEFIVNKNMDYIKNGTLSMYLEDDILYSFIEMYCLNHKIEFDTYDIDELMKNSPSSEISLYKSQITRYSVLKPEEEKELFKRYKNGDLSAKEKLINCNLRLVLKFAAHYLYSGISFADLIQEGNIGLITAVERFDVDKDYKFSTYAFWWIRQAIKRAVDNQSSAVRIPVHMREKYAKFRKIFGILSNELGRNPTEEELADEMGISVKEVKNLMRINLNCCSLNEKCGDDDGDAELGDFIANESFDLFDKIDDKILNSDIYELFKNVGLEDRQIYILSYRYGLSDDEERTLEWIAQKLGLTRERVRQIEMKALAKLRNNPATKKFANYMDDPEAAIAFVNSCKGSVYGSDKYKKQVQNSDLSNKKEPKQEKDKYEYLVEQKNRREEIMAKSRQNLYQLMPFDEKTVNEVLKYLSEDEIKHLKIRFGEDYKHPSDKLFTKKENNMFYAVIKPKMVRYAIKLQNGEKVDKKNIKSSKNKNSDEVNKPEEKRKENKIETDAPVIDNIEINNNDDVSNVNNNDVNENESQNNVFNDNLSNNDFKFNLDISEIANNIKSNDLSPLQMTVLSLKLGQINGKIFSNDEISKFLGISVDEIIQITKTALELYKTYIIDLVNQEFDKVIYDVSNVKVRSDK